MVALHPHPTSSSTQQNAVPAGSLDPISNSPETGVLRWDLMRVLYEVAASKSQRVCLRRALHGERSIKYGVKGSGVSVGAFACHSSFCASPYCGKHKTSEFTSSLSKAISNNVANGGEAYFITLTIQTDTGVDKQRSLLSGAYKRWVSEVSKLIRTISGRSVSSGVSWSFDKTFYKKKDNTYGVHLHKHLILHTSSRVSIEKEVLFSIWERAVRRASNNAGYYVSPNAFYCKKVESEGSAFYLSKLQQDARSASVEVGNSLNKRFGWVSLLEEAAKCDKEAKVMAHSVLKAFYNRSFQHLGKYASSMASINADTDEEMPDVSSNSQEEEVITLEVPVIVHNILIDEDVISSFFKFLMNNRKKELVSSWNILLEQYNMIDKEVSYHHMVSNVLHLLNTCLGFSVDEQKWLPERL